VQAVAMPILETTQFKSSTGNVSIAMDKRILMVAHSRGESLGQWRNDAGDFERQKSLNLFNLQGMAGTAGSEKKRMWEYRDSKRDPEKMTAKELSATREVSKGNFWNEFKIVTRMDKKENKEKKVVRELYRASVDVPLYATKDDAVNAYLGKLEQAWNGAFKALTTATGTKEGFYKGLGAYGTHSNYGEGKDKKKAPGHPLDPVLNDTKKLLSEYADERIVMAKAGIKTATEAKPPEQY